MAQCGLSLLKKDDGFLNILKRISYGITTHYFIVFLIFVSLDVTENTKYITDWFTKNIW